jgi:hypothetical protein
VLNILAIPLLMLFQQGHVTFTGIEHVNGTDSLKVSVRMNYELFLRDYQQSVFDDLDLEVLRSFRPFPADLANNYLNSKIYIYANKKQVIGKLLKMEEVEGDIRFNMLYRVDRNLKIITMRNTLLNGLYGDVENLTIVKCRDHESGTKFTREHNEETLHLK